jgi:hypothetical protein
MDADFRFVPTQYLQQAGRVGRLLGLIGISKEGKLHIRILIN